MSDRLTLKDSRVGVAELSESIRSHPALHKRRSRFQALITLIAGDNGRRQCQFSKLTQLTHVLIKWSTPLHLIVTLNESLFGFCFLSLSCNVKRMYNIHKYICKCCQQPQCFIPILYIYWSELTIWMLNAKHLESKSQCWRIIIFICFRPYGTKIFIYLLSFQSNTYNWRRYIPIGCRIVFREKEITWSSIPSARAESGIVECS